MADATSLLSVEDLHITYKSRFGTVDAVRGVTFDVGHGEAIGIVGESGCGKTAMILGALRLLLEPPAVVSGTRASLGETDLLRGPVKERRMVLGQRVGVVFQDPLTYLNPLMKIGQQIIEGVRFHQGLSRHNADDRAVELLQQVGMPDAERRVNEYPHQLSGGMRQRALIAMALAGNPQLLVADEPTTALDVTVQAQILSLVAEVREAREMALMWVSHDIAVVARVAERVLVMYAGRVVEDGPVREVLQHPSHPYTRALIGAIPRVGHDQPRLETIAGSPPDLTKPIKGCSFAPRCPDRVARCSEESPAFDCVGPEHRVACWVALESSS
jgi:oligopeptide/dipeptide ABC transporter ATP-binding protein